MLDNIADDLHINVLEFLEFSSASDLMRVLQKQKTNDQFFESATKHVWLEAAERMGLIISPERSHRSPLRLLEECRQRWKWEQAFASLHFYTAHGANEAVFSFIPSQQSSPDQFHTQVLEDSPNCDCFLLTNLPDATSGEYVWLNHDSGEFRVNHLGRNQPSQVLLSKKSDGLPFESRHITVVGVEVKPFVSFNGTADSCPKPQILGACAVVGRAVQYENEVHDLSEYIELLGWYSSHDRFDAETRWSCRFPTGFQAVDMDVTHKRVYVSPTVVGDGMRPYYSRAGQPCVRVYTFQPDLNHEADDNSMSDSPLETHQATGQPLYQFVCRDAVTDIGVDVTGNWVVTTTLTGVEVWRNSSGQATEPPKRVAALSNADSWKWFPAFVRAGSGPLQSVFLPKYHSIQKFGFWVFQQSVDLGTAYLIWYKSCGAVTENSWKPTAMVQVPLSRRRKAPKVIWNGRRLLVVGQDAAGLVLFVYQCSTGVDDDVAFDATSDSHTFSNGILYPSTNEKKPDPTYRVQLQARIRHDLLGGLDYWEHLHVSGNDRYVMINTRKGDSIRNTPGVWVVDLAKL